MIKLKYGICAALAALALTSFSQTAAAGVLIMPNASYMMGTYKMEYSGTVDNGKYSGTSLGVLGAYELMIPLFVGGYVNMDSFKSEPDSGTGSDASGTVMGLAVGTRLPLGLIGYVGYGFSDKFTQKAAGGDVVYTGSELKFSVGFSVIPMVNVGVEYRMKNVSKIESGGSDLTSSFTKKDFNSTNLVVSVPLSF